MDLLDNTVRTYAWGSPTAIPALLGREPTGEPQAELWMGAHPGAPSRVDRGEGPVPLTTVVAADPVRELGTACVGTFGPELPFLFKVLAAAAPLSLQVHPDARQAREGYADEEARGVPLDAPHRTYKDDRHKPELLCALTPFEGLCGFRPPRETADLLAALDVGGLAPYVDILRARPGADALREVFTAVLTADRDAVAGTVTAAAASAERLAAAGGAHAAAYAAYAGIARHCPGDPGVLAAMLLHHVRLRPGEALYLGAGVPHAYLDGLGVELMANSDNVLRCGLTPKHVDVPELLRVVRFETAGPAVLRPRPDGHGGEVYASPAAEFRLTRYLLRDGDAPRDLGTGQPQILLCTEGRAQVATGPVGGTRELARGQSGFVPAAVRVRLTGNGTIFRATAAV
jgi:mannose-6-phosphate isomerase